LRPQDLIEVKREVLNDIPCLVIRPRCLEGRLPTLFHYHGWSSKKENHEFLGRTIAQYGFQVILPDSNLHGDRNPLNKYDTGNLKTHFWDVATQSVREFPGIRQEVQEILDVDPKRIAVSGSSMGGFITSSIFAQNRDIKCLIAFNGGSAWLKTEEIIKEKFGEEVTKKIDRMEAQRYDPLTYKVDFYPRPILILHGDSDTSVPVEIQRFFHQEVAPYYREDPKRLRIEIYPNMNHHISIRMVESAVGWLERYL